jgi:ubiquinone/menaquinone biosynthesis C-methylase UbiE
VRQALSAIPKGSRILDAGCGEQQYRKFCSHLHYIGQDFGAYDGRGDGFALQTKHWDQSHVDIVSDIVGIPVANQSFDAILCTEVFEHIPDPAAALREFSRILKQDGLLILTAPFASFSHFTPYFYSTGFSSYWYLSSLPPAGFEIISIQSNGSFFDYLAQEIWRLPGVVRLFCRGGMRVLAAYCALLFLGLPLLAVLQLIQRRDEGSDSLACFGYHVIARRIPLESSN